MNEALDVFGCAQFKVRVHNRLGQFDDELILFGDRGDGQVHIVDFVRVQAECVAAVNEGIRVCCLFKCLAQQVLPAFRVRNMLVNSQYDVIGGQRLGG